jgi:uncharacterized protein (DUF934 family)
MDIIEDGRLLADCWQHLDDEMAVPASGAVTVSLARWQAERAALAVRDEPVGLRLEASDTPEAVSKDLGGFPLIVLNFASMADGRLFSLARLLRERYGFAGELRARGDFIQDQMFFLSRVGVDAFEPSGGATPEDVAAALATFSVTYQGATDEKRPLYRRMQR